MRFLSLFLVLVMAFSAQAGGVSRSRARVVDYHNNNQVLIEQKVIQYGDSLQIIAVPVTDLNPAVQYYYQSEPLRGRNLSEADRKAIVEEVVAGVLAGIDARFDVVGENGKPVVPDQGGGTVEPPKEEPVTPVSDLEKQVLNIFTNSCAICHTEGGLNAEGIPVLLASDGSIKKLADPNLEQLKRFKVWESTFYNHMPLNGTPLNEEQLDILHKWIKVK